MSRFPLTLVLDNIRSAYNVGAMLRLADCAGLHEVITCGYTPTAEHPKVQKTALLPAGAIKSRHFADLQSAINQLQAESVEVFALEISPNSKSIWDQKFELQPTAFVLGNEVEGVQLEVTRSLGVSEIHLPQYGSKESLNVASAAAIAVYDVIKRWDNSLC